MGRRGWFDAGTKGDAVEHMADTWADMRGWGKGLLWVNGANLGWYWPLLGPQMRMYVPGPLLREGRNDIVLLEFAQAPANASGEHWNTHVQPCSMKATTNKVFC
jgi:hypothetical protein